MTNSQTELFTVTEVELLYRNKKKAADRPKIKTSKDAFDLLLQSWEVNKIELLEQFKILLLDRSNSCIGISNVSTGGISSCVVDPKIIFATALKARTSGLILAHNHPSGNITPSQNDIDLTKKLHHAGKFLEMEILDHLIVTPEKYYSIADEGMMP